MTTTALLLALTIDGDAALRHASRLAALGPHPWGSPRARVAATYVAEQLRDAGLSEVRFHEFEAQGVRGTNVIGVLRGQASETVVIAAHHDTAPEAPGAYDDGGGVGVLIEAARALARERRSRTFVFASFDGEEAWSRGTTTLAGSRAWIESLGAEARRIVAVLDVEMCGWTEGTPVLHPLPYADPLRRGTFVAAPPWLVEAALHGSGAAGVPFSVGDPRLSWVYQPAVRLLRIRLYGDDQAFLQQGIPGLMLSDSSFSRFYPWYHESGDTADKLEARSLERMGRAVLGAATAVERATPGTSAPEPWFAAFGQVAGAQVLLVVGFASLLPGLVRSLGGGGLFFVARLLHGALFAVVLWRHPVPALWTFLLPNLATGLTRSRGAAAVSVVPVLSLAVVGTLAWQRGMAFGFWPRPWELVVAGLAFLLVWVRSPSRTTSRRSSKVTKPPKKSGRRGLPK